jgi:mono/diheme cytochrome c family protein
MKSNNHGLLMRRRTEGQLIRILTLFVAVPLMAEIPSRPKIPRTWETTAIEDWSTPLAGLNARPGHFSEAEYYAAPVDNLRTYPVYYPGREPEGYWEMLNKVGPQPLIEPEKLKSETDWVRAGKEVFEQHDIPAFRSLDPKLIAAVRSVESYEKAKYEPRSNGQVGALRWIPTAGGVAIGLVNCAGCHQRKMVDGTLLDGAPSNERAGPFAGALARWGVSPFPLENEPMPLMSWRAFAVPWIKDDAHESFKSMEPAQLRLVVAPAFSTGLFPRWSGSPLYVTKIPDLIGLKEQKYIDHTATHRHRGPGDIMRYAALVTAAEAVDFGPHRVVTDAQRKVQPRLTDEALYALTLYLYSLKPPPNPHPFDEKAARGKKVFEREGCAGCHAPPHYTNKKVTLAEGFTPTKEHSKFLDIMPVSVGTDPGLATKTRKGTGYYKIPSLKGIWYRGHYLHDGSLTSLEEMFDPARLRDDFAPSGFKRAGTERRAVKGHKFGLNLGSEEREGLIAFLKTL